MTGTDKPKRMGPNTKMFLGILATALTIYGLFQIGPLNRKMSWSSDMTNFRTYQARNLKARGATAQQIKQIQGSFPSPPPEITEIQLGKNWDSVLGLEGPPPPKYYPEPPQPVNYSGGLFFIGMSTPSRTGSSAKNLEEFAGVLRNSYRISDRNMILLQGSDTGNRTAIRGRDAELSRATLEEMTSTLRTGAFGNKPISPNSRVMVALFNDGTYNSKYGHNTEDGYLSRENVTQLIQDIPAQSMIFLEAAPSNFFVYSDLLFGNKKPNKNVLCLVPPNRGVVANIGRRSPPGDDSLRYFTNAINRALRNPDMRFADLLGTGTEEFISSATVYYSPKGVYTTNERDVMFEYHNGGVPFTDYKPQPIESISLASSIQRFIKGDASARGK